MRPFQHHVRRRTGLLAAGALLVASLGWGVAQSVAAPSQAAPARFAKPITIVVTFPPGGGTDLLARKLGAELQHSLGQTVLDQGYTPAKGSPADFQALIHADIDRFTQVTRQLGLRVD